MKNQMIACILLLLATPAPAMESLPIALSTNLSAYGSRSDSGTNWIIPAAGEIVVVGELNLAKTLLADPYHLQLRLPDGSVRPVWIDRQTIVREFGRVAFLRFAAPIPAAIASREGLALEYGDDVQSTNTLVSGLAIDPARRDAFRAITFERAVALGNGESESPELRLNIVADSHMAQSQIRSRLLFLLPIAWVVVVAFARFFARRLSHDGA